jgi:hypothetical protein
MLRPDRAHLFIRREFASLGLRQGLLKRRFLFGRQLHNGLLLSGELKEQACEVVLHLRRQTTHGFDGTLKKFGHVSTIGQSLAANEEGYWLWSLALPLTYCIDVGNLMRFRHEDTHCPIA